MYQKMNFSAPYFKYDNKNLLIQILKSFKLTRLVSLFQEFDDYRDADDAIHDLNGKELLGTRITVEHARGPRREGRRDGDRRRAMWVDKYGPPTRTKYRMVVENLSTKMSWQVRKKFEFSFVAFLYYV